MSVVETEMVAAEEGEEDDIMQLCRHLCRFARELHNHPMKTSDAACMPVDVYHALTVLKDHPRSTTGSLSLLVTDESLHRVSDFVSQRSGSDLHSTVLQTILLATDSDLDSQDVAAICILCLVLACIAIDKVPVNQATGCVMRPRRWQSICFETIRLYQSQLEKSRQSTCSSQEKHYGVWEWLPLWTQVVVPCTKRLQDRLPQSEPSKMMAFKVGVASTCTLLARMVVELSHVEQLPSDWALMNSDALLGLVRSVIGNDSLSLLARVIRNMTLQSSHEKEEEAFIYWLEQDGDEEIAGMHTHLDELGLAVLSALLAMHQRRTSLVAGVVGTLPIELPAYFYEGIDQVSVLLSVAIDDFVDDDDLDSTTGTAIDTYRYAEEASSRYHSLGLALLTDLLVIIPEGSLRATWIDYDTEQSSGTTSQPVLGAMQLLANRIARAAMGQEESDKMTLISTCQETFRLMQQFVCAHEPQAQVIMVRELLTTCPYLELRPKILDLLRETICKKSFDDETMGLLFQLLDEVMLQPLDDHFPPGVVVGTVNRLIELFQSMELYDSALNLVYLILAIMHVRPNIPNLQSRCTRIRAALGASLEQWQADERLESPELAECFRLNLLDMSLEKVLNQLTMLSASDEGF